MKAARKFLSMAISILTLISIVCITPASAVNLTASYQSYSDQISTIAADIMYNTIYPEKELYGLDETDFIQLSIGNEIPAYVFTNDGIQPSDTVFIHHVRGLYFLTGSTDLL